MYETYSRSRIHEAYPQLRAHAFNGTAYSAVGHTVQTGDPWCCMSLSIYFSELKTRRRGFALAYRGGSRHSFITKS